MTLLWIHGKIMIPVVEKRRKILNAKWWLHGLMWQNYGSSDTILWVKSQRSASLPDYA